MRTPLTGEQLRNFQHLDLDRSLKAEGGAVLLRRILDLASSQEQRKKALQPSRKATREHTASVLLANLASAALRTADDTKFVGVSLNGNNYSNKTLSVTAMSLLVEVLLANGLIEGRLGGRRTKADDAAFGWVTRVRATSALRAIFAECSISRSSIQRAVDHGVLVLRRGKAGVPREPPADVELSRRTVEDMNRRILAARIELPADAWQRIPRSRLDALADALELDEDDRAATGDLARKSLMRLFKFDWTQGGRLYGGWWIGLPKEERKCLTIDGEPVWELDYGQLHPSILYARMGEELDGDAYTLGGWAGPLMRELGKRTFARMLNTTTKAGEARQIQIKPEDVGKLPEGVTWERYLRAFQRKHEPISEYFWIGEGLRLQREDSDLAVSVLETMNQHGVVTLPVHDSFIVQIQHRHLLRTAMIGSYREKFYYPPIIK